MFLLLGLLLSYNLDLECFLDRGTSCQQLCESVADDICAEPSYWSSHQIALPSRPFEYQAYLTERVVWLAPAASDPRPTGPRLTASLRLRAPPKTLV